MAFVPTTPQFQRGYNFQTKEFSITNVKLHSMIDGGYLLPNCITGFQVFPSALTGNEQLLIASSGVLYNITTQTLVNLAVAASIPNNSITDSKMVRNTLLGGGGGSIALDTVTGGTGAGVGNIPGGTIHGYNVSNDLTRNNFAANEIRLGVGYIYPVVTTMNGDMQVWQRQTSWAGLGGAIQQLSDRWRFFSSAGLTGRITASQQLVDISGTSNYPHTAYCLRAAVTTAQASLAAGDFVTFSQKIERQIAKALFDQNTSLSLVLRSSVAGVFCIAIRNNNAGTPNQSYVAECNVNVTNSFIRFPIQNIAALTTGTGTWGASDTDYAYEISICFGAGATFQTTANAWQSGNFVADANQLNLLATNGATFDVTLVQHELGAVCTPFLWVPYDASSLRCNRYYSKSLDPAIFAGSASTNGFATMTVVNTSQAFGFTPFTVPMRLSPPAVNVYNPASGAINSVVDESAGAGNAVTGAASISSVGFSQITSSATFTAGHVIGFHYTADAEFS